MNDARRSVVVLFLVAFAALAGGASAREVSFPLTVGPPLVREEIVKQMFTDPGGRAVFWGEPGSCSFFYLEDPEVEGAADSLRVRAHGEARLGTEFLGGCLSPIVWNGTLEISEKPRLDGWSVLFEVVDSNIYDEQGGKPLLTGTLWDRIKESVQPRFAAVRIDLGGPFEQLRTLLPLVLDPDQHEAADRVLRSLRPVSATASPRGVTVEAAVDVAGTAVPPGPSAPEPPLTVEEVEAFTAHLNQWDAFVTFVVKQLGERTLEAQTRDALLVALLEARYEILDALETPHRREDPVRRLFVSTWGSLRPLADEIARELPGAEALRIVTFMASGDALVALDRVGPALGLEISADGLRRMARMVAPAAPEDPLEYTPAVDPKLRLFLGFGPPEPPSPLTPAGTAPPARSVPSAVPPALAPVPPAVPPPAAPPGAPPPPTPSAWWLPVLRWLAPATALAAEPDRTRRWEGWFFARGDDVRAYLGKVGKVLEETARVKAKAADLGGREAKLFTQLVPAAAWQESCWRQFLRRGGQVTYIRSSHGSVGILQVNERVWRGFYDVDPLRWDIAYNARAGADILLRYQELALKSLPELSDDGIPRAGRAVYAAYNGGPGQLRRYLKGAGPKTLRVVNELFGKKFDTSLDDMEAEVARCLTGG